jgi:lipoprotein-anchoring transpeptidase ErfK/SrfK
MTQARENRRLRPRVTTALVFAGAFLLAPAVLSNQANAQILGYAPAQRSSFPADNLMTDEGGVLPERLRRATVAFDTREAPGTIIIDTGNTALYYVLGQGRAIRYGVGVGRDGFTWSGVQTVSRKAEWPDWHPPAEMKARWPHVKDTRGGPDNPLGARALYLFEGNKDTLYRIHGTNEPEKIGRAVSSGCIRMRNIDVVDLYNRVEPGSKVIVQ